MDGSGVRGPWVCWMLGMLGLLGFRLGSEFGASGVGQLVFRFLGFEVRGFQKLRIFMGFSV